MAVILITGGARCGKSRYAEATILSLSEDPTVQPVHIATAEPLDSEMTLRIARHQARRDARWLNIEAPIALAEALRETDGRGPRLVDCLTLWLSNLMLADMDWEAETTALCQTLESQASHVILVTNEVGFGIVPENPLSRQFRDNAGLLNQMVARVADELILMVAGLPMKVK